VTVSGVDIVTRSSTTNHDTQGEFATSNVNALSQSESFIYDARFGKPTSHTGPNSRPAWSAGGNEHVMLQPVGFLLADIFAQAASPGPPGPSSTGTASSPDWSAMPPSAAASSKTEPSRERSGTF
jgi:hypothetical protein